MAEGVETVGGYPVKVSLELLYHYQCDACQKWWSVADITPQPGETVWCPHCRNQDVVPIKVLLGSDFKPAEEWFEEDLVG